MKLPILKRHPYAHFLSWNLGEFKFVKAIKWTYDFCEISTHYFILDSELLFTSIFGACNSLASRRPTNRSSYSTILLDTLKANLNTKYDLFPFELVRIMPTPQPVFSYDPSMNNLHVLCSGSSLRIGTSDNSATKSINVYALIVDHPLYHISNCPNSTTHFISLPSTLGF